MGSAWDALERGFDEAADERWLRADLYNGWETAGPDSMTYEDNYNRAWSAVEEHTMDIRISYTQPGRTGRQTVKTTIPEDARNIRCEIEIPVEPADDFDVVRVRFEPGGREYCYRYDPADGIQVHDYVVAPPNSFKNQPQVVRVTGFGRNHYTGAIYASVAPIPAGASTNRR